RVVIFGATNRPNDINSAFQRRLSKRIINFPNQIQRKEILKKLLQGASLHDDVDIDEIAKKRNLFSGSDLKKFVLATLMIPVQERIRNNPENPSELRSVEMKDFIKKLIYLFIYCFLLYTVDGPSSTTAIVKTIKGLTP
ncbi:hypothetical protein ROZALSC1DRAFT_15241, partial [Rozella allomycis CSF55]